MYFKASVLSRAHNVNRDSQEQLDRQNYITKIPMTKLKDKQVFRIKGPGV